MFKQNKRIIPVPKSALVINIYNEHYHESYTHLMYLEHIKGLHSVLLFTNTSANNMNINLKICVYQILC